MQHFLTLNDLSPAQLQGLIDRALALKAAPEQAVSQPRRTLGLVFDKASTRTRVAFEVAMNQLDGAAVFLSAANTQLGRGEPIADSARVLSRMVDCLAVRTFAHATLTEFANYSTVPVINALSDDFHPCQLLADVMTFQEHRGSIKGKRVAWIGDGNNMCHSYINAAGAFDFELLIAAPAGYYPSEYLIGAQANASLVASAEEAARGADLVVTDVWASMGQEQEQSAREKAFAGYRVDEELMAKAASDALFMHCLPAHRGEEVTAAVLDGANSVIWDEAENRLHSQKALLELLLTQT